MQEKANKYYRYGTPNKYDQHPKGTHIVIIPNTLCKKESYQQISSDPTHPQWVKVDLEDTAETPKES